MNVEKLNVIKEEIKLTGEPKVIKNYKLACVFFGEDIKAGNSKKSQMKEWERYLAFETQGQKFIFKEVYEETRGKMDKRNGGNNCVDYIPYVEKLILDLLVQSYHKDSVCLSKNKLLKELKMINENYAFCKVRIPKLSKFTGVQQETIDEWYSSTDTTLRGNIEKALNNLRNQSLIFWSNEISVCKMEVQSINGNYDVVKKVTIDEYDEEVVQFKVDAYTRPNFREATDEEKRFIIHTERETMIEMDFRSKSDIVKFGKWNIFKEKINKIILNELNIDYYYNSYKLLWNQDHILEKYEEFIDDLLLSKEERKETQELLNLAVIERLNSNVEKKQNRAVIKAENTYGKIKDDRLRRRVSDTYLDENQTLAKTLINTKSKNIKNKIKKTKIEKS